MVVAVAVVVALKSKSGKIRLDVPVKSGEGEEIITEVLLHPKFYPGGTHAMNRVGSEMVNVCELMALLQCDHFLHLMSVRVRG